MKIATRPERSKSQFGSNVDRDLPFLPAVLAILLCLPVLGFTYLWDDYSFLTNALFYQLHGRRPLPESRIPGHDHLVFSLVHYADMIPRSKIDIHNTKFVRVTMPDF